MPHGERGHRQGAYPGFQVVSDSSKAAEMSFGGKVEYKYSLASLRCLDFVHFEGRPRLPDWGSTDVEWLLEDGDWEFEMTGDVWLASDIFWKCINPRCVG